MKHLAHLLSLSMIALGCVSAPPPAPPTRESLRVERLISLWDAKDGAGGTEYGPRLSEAFVAAPDDFFLAMSAHPSSFDSWLQALPHSTFTAYIPERLPAITTLLPAMRSTADRFRNHPRYGPMATRLSAALQSVVVREVD